MLDFYPIIEHNFVTYENKQQITINDKSYDGFYISYNNYDIDCYGCETTALVLGQMELFYILKGDHRKQYKSLIDQDFDCYINYYLCHLNLSHPYSDKITCNNRGLLCCY